jgi:hypothetical protein
MDFQSLTALYAGKADEELLKLSRELEHLTPEAQSALRIEMSNRRMTLEQDMPEVSPGPPANKPSRSPVVVPVVLPAYRFFEDVFRIYRQHLWTFFMLTLPAVAIGTVAVIGAQNHARQIAEHASPGWQFTAGSVLLKVLSLSAAGWVFSWIAFCLAFAGICATVRHVVNRHDPSVPTAAYEVLMRLRPLLSISIWLLVVFLLSEFLCGFVALEVVWRIYARVFGDSSIAFRLIVYLFIGTAVLITSRFSLAVPAVILDNSTVRKSLFLSHELTKKRWSILGVLVAKSVVGGYVAGKLPFWLSPWLLVRIHIFQVPWWFLHVMTAASVVAVSYVEPIMFIGFALLYEKTSCRSLIAPHESATVSACSG